MERYYVIPYDSWANDSYHTKYFPCNPGSIIYGSGDFKFLVDDFDIIEREKFMRVVYCSPINGKYYNPIRRNNDGTIEQIEIYSVGRHAHGTRLIPDESGLVELDCRIPVIDRRNSHGTAVGLNNLFQKYIQMDHKDLIPYFNKDVDLYVNLYKFYKRRSQSGPVTLQDFMLAYAQYFRRTHELLSIDRYFPKINPTMFSFNGPIDKFDYVKAVIPMSNPTRGIEKLLDVVNRFKKEVFSDVYDTLEECSGVPKQFFKMTDCILTDDERLVCTFNVKEHPVGMKEAE